MLTTRELNRSTLARQLLLGREALDVAEAVRRVVAPFGEPLMDHQKDHGLD